MHAQYMMSCMYLTLPFPFQASLHGVWGEVCMVYVCVCVCGELFIAVMTSISFMLFKVGVTMMEGSKGDRWMMSMWLHW